MSHRRLLVPAILAALAAALVSVPVAAGTPTPPSAVSAWVVNRSQGAFNVAVTPGPLDQGGSTSGSSQITRLSKGSYRVRLAGVGTALGTVQVTPINSAPRWCFPTNWGESGSDVVVDVSCQDAAGSAANSSFVLAYVKGSGGHGLLPARLGYAWMNQPAGGSGGAIDGTYQYTSAYSTVTSTRTATGRYTVMLPAMAVTGGNVQLTSFETASTCRAASWAVNGVDEVITVACNDATGAAVDRKFDVLFLEKLGLEGWGGGPAAHLVATKPKAASYSAPAPYAYNSKGKAISILRGGVGNYTVILNGMPAGGAAIVTPYGTGTAKCQLSSLGTKVPMKAIVRCFTTAGAAVDAKFSLAYTK